MKIPVKIKLHNPLSLNNFTITDKRLYSVKQVTQNTWKRGFSEVRIILYTQLNFKYRCLILNMQYLNRFEGENIQSHRVCEPCPVCILNCKGTELYHMRSSSSSTVSLLYRIRGKYYCIFTFLPFTFLPHEKG